LETIIDDYINDAQQSITYSYVILQQSGIYSSSYITSAQELLESAEDNLENDYQAAALFETLEALVKANLAIENIDDDAEAKISRSRNSSSNSISESRNIGIEPVLAVSYYEYAESLVNESMYDSALIYYKYSNIIAGAMGFTSFSSTTTSSRYIGIPEIKNPVELKIYRISDMIVFGLFAFIIGGVGGILIGLIVSSGSKQEKPKKQITQQKWTPRNINDYYKKQKDNYYPNGQIPRSMKDYYKKNK